MRRISPKVKSAQLARLFGFEAARFYFKLRAESGTPDKNECRLRASDKDMPLCACGEGRRLSGKGETCGKGGGCENGNL
ncbi:MAG: hypothetical protein DBX55_08870, partial [Verrucomicrobia bacterium]